MYGGGQKCVLNNAQRQFDYHFSNEQIVRAGRFVEFLDFVFVAY